MSSKDFKQMILILAAAFGLWITTARAAVEKSRKPGSNGDYLVQVTDYNSGKPLNPSAPPADDLDEGFSNDTFPGAGGTNYGARGDSQGNTQNTLSIAPNGGRGLKGRQLAQPGGKASGVVNPGDKPRRCLKLDPYSGKGSDTIANFNFPDADVVEIAETLGRLTCLNFIFDKEVKGRISIVSNSPITTGDAWKAFLTSLDANGFSIIPSGRFMRIVRKADAKDKQVKTYSGDEVSPDSDLMITRLMPLKYVGAIEVERVLRNFIPPNARLVSHEASNTLIVTDTGANVKKLVDMIQILDVERVDERIEVVRLSFASATEVAKLVQQLIPSKNPFATPFNAGGTPQFGGGTLSGVRKTRDGGSISHIIPDDRTNSIIVSANEKGMQEVRQLVSKLDSRIGASAGGNRIHVVYLQFADSEEVAKTLNNLASNAQGQNKAPGSLPSNQLFESVIKVAADKATNALVVTGTNSDFSIINSVISKLDVPRDQVYVEAVIMETTLDKKFDFGTSIAAPNAGVGFTPNDDLGKFLFNPLSLPGVVLGFQDTSRAGKTFTVPGTDQTVTVNNIQGLIKLLLRNTKSNILATPQILTLDNQEAQIEISEKIPVPTTTNVPNVGVQTSITKENISLLLKIRPQINKSSNFVKLDIDQKLEDISDRIPPKAVQDLAFATSARASKTTVVVQDGDTVVMGGLVRDKAGNTMTKIPILGDIPILGWLFRSTSTSSLKQNLLVFITPKIIKQYQRMRTVLDEKLRERDDFLQRNVGGEDYFQEQKMRMIQSLPPLSDLKNNERVFGDKAEIGAAEPEVAAKEKSEISVINKPETQANDSKAVTAAESGSKKPDPTPNDLESALLPKSSLENSPAKPENTATSGL